MNLANPRERLAAIVLVASLLVAAFAYRPGFGGSYQFDDPHNLQGLSRVADVPSAFDYISEGSAGPLGRPLALALFASESYAWPYAPAVFLHTNVCLHLLNGALVVWMLYLLGVAAGYRRDEAAEIAALTGAVWLMLPILASSSLLIVQRMTVLSATFSVAGFIVYLRGRMLLAERPRAATLTMSAAVALGTLLAMLAKENGALLPAFILASEATLLRSQPAPEKVRTWWKIWRLAFLIAPTTMLLGYVATRVPYNETVTGIRNFSAPDRLLTEAYILWEYLRYAFIPSEAGLGPFHDDHTIYRDWLHPLSLLVVGAWGAVVAGAVALRSRAPLVSFGIAWYLVGHLLESTAIPLELYFEHRNYMPLIGPVFALVAIVTRTVPTNWRLLARGTLIAYTALLALVLLNTTSLWGRPLLAAEMWAIYSPDSRRAVQYLAEQYELAGDRATTRKVLREYLEEHPESADVALQILAATCLLQPDAPQTELLDVVQSNLKTGDFDMGVHPTLERLYRITRNTDCASVNSVSVYRFAALAASNPAYQAREVALHNLHTLMATESMARGDFNLTIHHLEKAFAAHLSFQTLELAVKLLNAADLHAAAEKLLEEARSREPAHPLHAARWRQKVAALENTMTANLRP